MSRIGRAPISIPAGVTVTVKDNLVSVKGPKGELSQQIHKDLSVSVDNGVLTVSRPSDDKIHRSMHGLSRTLINNMIIGVTVGFSKNLEIFKIYDRLSDDWRIPFTANKNYFDYSHKINYNYHHINNFEEVSKWLKMPKAVAL